MASRVHEVAPMIRYLLVVVVLGCAIPDDVELAETRQPVMSANKLGYNRLGYNRLGYNRLGYNKLSATRLSEASLLAGNWDDVLVDEDARELFKYVYSCAVPAGTQLAIDVAGQPYVFDGQIGLAPEWVSGTCDAACEEWVSACVIARINGLGVSVPLSLRGEHPALVVDEVEQAQFSFQEIAAFGNIFEYDDVTGFPRVLGVCKLPGVDHRLGYYGVADSHWLERRICGEPGQCGPLQVWGTCKNPNAYAAGQGQPQAISCERKRDGLVDACHAEVVTVPGRESLENGALAPYFATHAYRAINVVLQDRVCGDTFCDPEEKFCSSRFHQACAADCPNACDAYASCGDGICDGPMTRKRYTLPPYAIGQMSKVEVETNHTAYEPYEETAASCPQDCP